MCEISFYVHIYTREYDYVMCGYASTICIHMCIFIYVSFYMCVFDYVSVYTWMCVSEQAVCVPLYIY